MSGKDTHVRGLRVLGPVEYVLFFSLFVMETLIVAAGITQPTTTPSRS